MINGSLQYLRQMPGFRKQQTHTHTRTRYEICFSFFSSINWSSWIFHLYHQKINGFFEQMWFQCSTNFLVNEDEEWTSIVRALIVNILLLLVVVVVVLMRVLLKSFVSAWTDRLMWNTCCVFFFVFLFFRFKNLCLVREERKRGGERWRAIVRDTESDREKETEKERER